jgi:cytochrome P450
VLPSRPITQMVDEMTKHHSGDAHRRQRKMLEPIFSTPYIRALMPVFYMSGYQLRDAIRNEIHDKPKTVNIMHWLARAALEIMGQAGLGRDLGALEGRFETYVKAAKDIT